MRLFDHDIESWLDKGRLCITPHPTAEQINGVTVDIHLGNNFRTFNEYTTPFIDLSRPKDEVNAAIDSIMNEEIKLEDGEAFYLHSGELALGTTLESINMPYDLVGWLDGRSLLARLGLMIHITAHRIDPGWSGCIVLELFNVGKIPLALRPGMRIGALSFEALTGPAMRPYNFRKEKKYRNQQNTFIISTDEDKNKK